MSFTQGHALVIGVGSYPNASQLSVPLTAADAEQVAKILKLPEACAYPPEQVTLLTNETATRERILAELKRLARQTTAESTVLVFYSGHGLYSAAAQYHLTTHDSRLDANGFVVPETGIAQRELLKLIKRLPATRVLLIFNACHSGSINPAVLSIDETPTGGSGTNVSPELSAALLATGEGRVIITACKDEQKSYFDPQKSLTVFADILTRVLQGEDISTNKNVITVFQLYDVLYEKVEQTVQALWRVEQQPELTVSKGVGSMAVAFYQPKRRSVVLDITDPDGEHQPDPIVRSDQIRHQAAVRVVDPEASALAFTQLMAPKRTRKGGTS
ncbi:MAG: caspase family protein [Roseiflexaceae bacterium]|nr:caspase family protein [Roseiflexaceae bacterium]